MGVRVCPPGEDQFITETGAGAAQVHHHREACAGFGNVHPGVGRRSHGQCWVAGHIGVHRHGLAGRFAHVASGIGLARLECPGAIGQAGQGRLERGRCNRAIVQGQRSRHRALRAVQSLDPGLYARPHLKPRERDVTQGLAFGGAHAVVCGHGGNARRGRC